MELKFINPITNKENILVLEYPIVDYMMFRKTEYYDNGDSDLVSILDKKLNELDCTIEYSYGRLRMTTYPIYHIHLSEYYYYLRRINNPITYNKYIDKVIQRHIDNIVYEYEHPYIIPIKIKNKNKKQKKKIVPNKFFKQVSHDIITGKETYFYINPYTKEEIRSDNPDLLETLMTNKRKKVNKSNKIKNAGVPISSMTFSFKKK